jgi:hypothetical protein
MNFARAFRLIAALVVMAALAGCTKTVSLTASPPPTASPSPLPAASSPVPAASASAGLWQPPPDAVPSTGNYVYLESDAGDPVGDGHTYSYRPANAKLSVTAEGGHLSVVVHGDEDWAGDFQLPVGSHELVSAEFDDVHGYSSSVSTRAGLDWSLNGRSAGLITGWFVVDDVKYVGGALAAVDLRFEQHHAGDQPALHGQIHWDAPKVTRTPVPVPSFSPGAWRPARGATPSTGSYVYLVSDPGDYVGAGKTYTYTPADAEITVKAEGGLISVTVIGDEWWSGDFKFPDSFANAQVGHYGDLKRYPFNNPVRGGLDWSGEGRGSNELTGWFDVDRVTYQGTSLASLDLRFEQHSEGKAPALHGEIHWSQ